MGLRQPDIQNKKVDEWQKKGSEENAKRTTRGIRMRDDLFTLLKVHCAQNHLTISGFLEELVEKALQKEKK